MELEVSEKLGTQVKAIYQLFCVFNFLATTHRLGCDPLLTDLGGGGMHNLRYEGSCFFSKYLRVTPLSRGYGTNYNRGSRSLVRSSVINTLTTVHIELLVLDPGRILDLRNSLLESCLRKINENVFALATKPKNYVIQVIGKNSYSKVFPKITI
jgi:hypothetical protein